MAKIKIVTAETFARTLDVVNEERSLGTKQGDWDASTGAFPNGSTKNDSWVVSVDGTVDDVTFNVGDILKSRIDNAATDTVVDWVKIDKTEVERNRVLPDNGTSSTGKVLTSTAKKGEFIWEADLAGNSTTASELKTARNIALTGDATGNVDFKGDGNVEIVTTIPTNSVEYDQLQKAVSSQILVGNMSAADTTLTEVTMDSLRVAVFNQDTITCTDTVTLDFASSDNFMVILDRDITFAVTNADTRDGLTGTIVVKQDDTGGWEFTEATEFKTPRGLAIEQETAANAISVINYYIVDKDTVLINYMGDFS